MHDIDCGSCTLTITGPLGIYHNSGMCSTTPEGGTLVVNNVKSSHEQVECCTKADSASSAV